MNELIGIITIGERGPQGIQGPIGPVGPQGPQGPQGLNGDGTVEQVEKIATSEETLVPNYYYRIESNTPATSFTLQEGSEGLANEYLGEIKAEIETTLTFPSSVNWVGDAEFEDNVLTLEANKTFLFSIINNIGVGVVV